MVIFGSLVGPQVVSRIFPFKCMNVGSSFFNDLWIFDGGNWTWMSGNFSTNQIGSYGDEGVPSPSNVPGARRGAISWRDNNGNLWMFGGEGYGEESPAGLKSTMQYWHNPLC
jgi:hypothetical protein